VGTVVRPRDRRLGARKLWIAFAKPYEGIVQVDDGARQALVERGTSLLPVGVAAVTGEFDAGDAVEIADAAGRVFAKGLVRIGARELRLAAGRRTADLPEGAREVVHRDDLVVTGS
jgi:glutamate 5-kinase